MTKTVDELMAMVVDWYGTVGRHPKGMLDRHDKLTAIRAAITQALAEAREDAKRLDWIECNVMNGKLEIAQSIFKRGYEFGFHQQKLGVFVGNGTLREAIDAAIRKEPT